MKKKTAKRQPTGQQPDRFDRTAAELLRLYNDADTPALVTETIHALQYAARGFVLDEQRTPDRMPSAKTLARILRLADERGLEYALCELTEARS